jgi:hypothetical protein
MTQLESTTREAVARWTSLAKAFAGWYGSLPAAFLPSSVSADSVSFNSDILSDHYDIYEDRWTAGIANNYRVNTILVHEALIHQLDFLRMRYPNDLNEILELEDRISQSRHTVLSLIDAICASVPDLLQSNIASAGVDLLWPLYVSGQISPRTAPVPDPTLTWIVGRLDRVDADLGVHQAAMLAELLRRKLEVTEVVKDA